MRGVARPVLLLLLLMAALLPPRGVWACGPEELVQGCRIDEGGCVCGLGCHTTFRYSTRDQCQAALKGQQRDPCESSPCEHGGLCSQTWRDPGYRCHCANTGHYGVTCHEKCPGPEEVSSLEGSGSSSLVVQCLVI